MNSAINYLKKAHQEKFAIPQFNVCVLEEVKAAAMVAQDFKAPVIIGLSEGERKFMNPRVASAIVKAWSESTEMPMFINADHTHSLDLVKEALESGFSMIHFDGSKLEYEENLKQTKEAQEITRQSGNLISFEGELGYLKGSSSLHGKVEILPEDLTDPEQAKDFKDKTGLDLLAVAVGNVHGLDVETGTKDNLDIERIGKISQSAGLPLVLHGASDVSDDQIQQAISAGICKININTALRMAFVETIREVVSKSNEITLYKVMEPVVQELYKIMAHKIEIFGAKNKI